MALVAMGRRPPFSLPLVEGYWEQCVIEPIPGASFLQAVFPGRDLWRLRDKRCPRIDERIELRVSFNRVAINVHPATCGGEPIGR